MLLGIDIGNTNSVFGVYAGQDLRAHWRIETKKGRTADEYAATLSQLFQLAQLSFAEIDAAIVATVVPPALFAVEDLLARHFNVRAVVVGPGTRTGMPLNVDNPREVGADRIVNAVAAYERFHQGCIVVDFGTATTFDVVSEKGEYWGGAIAPGITTSADALYLAAAKLPRVEIVRPQQVIGRNTVASMQSGLFFGYVGMVDAMVTRMLAQLDFPCRVIATGGLAPLIAKDSRTIEETSEMLTLEGLRIIHDRNPGTGSPQSTPRHNS